MECNGRGDSGDHCCYVDGQVCPLLTFINGQPRCSLMLKYNDWNKVYNDEQYLTLVKPSWERCGVSDCGVFGTGRDGKPKQCCHKEKI